MREKYVIKVSELIEQLQSVHCPKDAKIVCIDDSVVPNQTVKPQVIWWSDDRKTVYLGMI
jgi:hypothetical protein